MLLLPVQIYAADTTLTTVTLQLKWKHQFQFAGYYAAIEKGYYKDFGLDVVLIEANAEQTPTKAISEGDADFAIVASDVVLMREEGCSVVILASVFQHSAQILLAPKWSKISHIHNLIGKKIMIENHSADLIAFMNDEGVTLNQIKYIPHSFDVRALINKKVDAMTAYSTTEPFVLEQRNIEYSIISPRSGGIDFYGDVLITSEKLLKERLDIALNFREASLKGWDYAMNNKKEIIDLIYTKYSKRLSVEHLFFEAEKMHNLILPDVIEIGYSNPGRWSRIIEIYKQTGMLDKDFDISGLLYTDYLKNKTHIPWKLIAIFIIGLALFSLATLFFYKLSQKLKEEIKKTEQLSQFKEDMTNMIVHDLKTPLSSVINAKHIEDENTRDDLVQQSGYRMLNLIENILSVYKYEQSNIELSRIEMVLIDIVNEALEEVSFLAKQKLLTIEIAKELNCTISADKEIIRRVFVNLFANAVKFSPSSGVISIKTVVNNKGIRVSVFNQGVSINKDKQVSIFERFEQADKKDSGKIGSTGLGLTFCKMAVEAHGGEIGVVSEVDADVEFWFSLPNSFISYVNPFSNKKAIIVINDIDKDYLKPFVVELKKLKIYEITTINKVLAKITLKNKAIEKWVRNMERVVDYGDGKELSRLLKFNL